MEEAYTSLYQEFLRLQFLCLRQAAMLQRLTEALRHQQGGAPLSNGELHELLSDHFLCGQEGPGAPAHPGPAAPPSHCAGPAAVRVVGAMERLRLGEEEEEEGAVGEDSGAGGEAPGQNRAPGSGILEELRQVEERWHGDRPTPYTRGPWSSSFLSSGALSEAGGMLVSRVTLESRVCEFCHAVFPGHTATRGDFLRHLSTHV